MAILSKRLMSETARLVGERYRVRPRFMDLSGGTNVESDALSVLSNTRRRRDYALQQSINTGEPHLFEAAPGLATWVVPLEDRRRIHGGLVGGEILVSERRVATEETSLYLVTHGMSGAQAESLLRRLPEWPDARVREAASFAFKTFYQLSGWTPELVLENRRKIQQQKQLTQAIEDQKRAGVEALYAFEKERVLLSNIRAGDRNGARRILNEMLAAIYMSSPRLVVLRARAIELVSCLTRAAIEDNPLMEPLIEVNHRWTERLIRAVSFESLSGELMTALDDFIDGIYLHGVNRSNTKVQLALDFISRHFAEPISLRDVARAVDLSASRLAHLVKDYTGKTVVQIIHETRVRLAQRLLERTSTTCADIAYEVGFGDQSYFIKHFKRLTGVTPARYRRAPHRHSASPARPN
jgi:two-component system, response regulator YesN